MELTVEQRQNINAWWMSLIRAEQQKIIIDAYLKKIGWTE